MSQVLRGCASTLLVLTVVAAFCESALGTWYGHVDVRDVKRPPKVKAKEFYKTRDDLIALKNQLKVRLVLNADKSFLLTSTGVFPKPETLQGYWKQAGQTISLLDAGDPRTLGVGSNGKNLLWTLKDGFGAKIIFMRKEVKAKRQLAP